MGNQNKQNTINLDVYESLENFVHKNKKHNIKFIKLNVTKGHPNSTVEFLRYFIV